MVALKTLGSWAHFQNVWIQEKKFALYLTLQNTAAVPVVLFNFLQNDRIAVVAKNKKTYYGTYTNCRIQTKRLLLITCIICNTSVHFIYPSLPFSQLEYWISLYKLHLSSAVLALFINHCLCFLKIVSALNDKTGQSVWRILNSLSEIHRFIVKQLQLRAVTSISTCSSFNLHCHTNKIECDEQR